MGSLVLAFVLTPFVRRFALKTGAVSIQNRVRDVHPKGTIIPGLGGWSVIAGFLFILTIYWYLGYLTDLKINNQQIITIYVSSLLIMVVGYLDDKYELKPWQLIIVPIIISMAVVYVGVSVEYVTNPFESGTGPYGRSLFYLNAGISSVFSFLWILGMMFTVKFLDGLDGLVTGIGAIGAIILFVVSLFWDTPLSGTSILALALAGGLVGFLPYNWHPAKIFLGESSIFVGFMLGVLSIISGGKIATALLVMGIPVLDVVWVIIKRIIMRKSPFHGDRTHLHFRLLDTGGLTHRQTVLFLYVLTAIFGVSSIFLQSTQKVLALLVLIASMFAITFFLFRKNLKKR